MTKLLIAATMVFSASLMASDFSHECRNAYGNLVMVDGQLEDSFSGLSYNYQTVYEQILEQKQGSCYSPKAKTRYAWENKSYLMKIKYTPTGSATEQIEYMICNLASSGVPANVNDCN